MVVLFLATIEWWWECRGVGYVILLDSVECTCEDSRPACIGGHNFAGRGGCGGCSLCFYVEHKNEATNQPDLVFLACLLGLRRGGELVGGRHALSRLEVSAGER